MSVIIKNLAINNFKGIVGKNIEFGLGLTTIQGPNFSGKTTVTQALLYALYGPTVVPGKADDMANATKGGLPSVSLLLSDGHEVKRSGGNATLLKDGKPVARSASIVSSEVATILGLEKDQTLKTRVSQQGEAQLLLATDNAELKRLVEDLAGCNIIDKILTLSKGYKKVLKGKEEGLQESYIGDAAVKSLVQEMAQAGKDTERMENELTAVQGVYSKVVADHSVLHEQLTKIKADNKLAETAKLRLSQLSGTVLALEESLLESKVTIGTDTAEKLTGEEVTLRETLEQALAELEEAKDRENEFVNAGHAVNKKITEMESQAGGLQKVDEILKGLPTAERQRELVEELGEERAVAVAEVTRLSAAIESSSCPECGRAYEADHTFNKEEAVKNMEEWREKAKNAGLSRDVESNTLQLIAKHERERGRFQGLLDISTEELREFRAALSKATVDNKEGEVDALRGVVKDIAPVMKTLSERVAMVVAAETSLEKANVKVALCYTEIQELKETSPEVLDTEEKEVELAEKVTVVGEEKAKIVGLQSQITFTKAAASTAAARAGEAQLVGDSLKGVAKSQLMHTKLVKLISTNRATLMQNVWGGILQEATEFVSAVTEGYVSNVSVDKAFKVVYTEGGKVFPVTSASGSQKSLIGLGIRLGIGSLLPNNAGFFIMDEVTADMEETVSMLAMSVAKTKCDQIIAVSHRDSDMAASDNIVTMARG